MFRRYPRLRDGRAELGALCRWAASEGKPEYVRWLLPRLMEPKLAVRWAILAAKRHYHDADWNKWADGWLSGEDRTDESVWAAWAAAREAAWAATWMEAAWAAATAAAWAAAAAATWAASAASAWEAEWASAYAHDAAEDKAAEIERQIGDALEILSVPDKEGGPQ